MVSAVGEAREHINAAAEEAQSALDALGGVRQSIKTAMEKLDAAASDSSHDAVGQSREHFEASLAALSEAEDLVNRATASARDYLDHII
jgi:hypothetical protein